MAASLPVEMMSGQVTSGWPPGKSLCGDDLLTGFPSIDVFRSIMYADQNYK